MLMGIRLRTIFIIPNSTIMIIILFWVFSHTPDTAQYFLLHSHFSQQIVTENNQNLP